MTSKIDLSSSSDRELSALEQDILIEESRRVINSSSAIVVEPDAPEQAHKDTLKSLLAQAANKS